MFRLRPIAVAHTESSGSGVSVQAQGWLMGFKMFRVCWEWSDVFRNGVHHFGNAVDGSERPEMGSGLVSRINRFSLGPIGGGVPRGV